MKYYLYRDGDYINEGYNKQYLVDSYEEDIKSDYGGWSVIKTSNRSANPLKYWLLDNDNDNIKFIRRSIKEILK